MVDVPIQIVTRMSFPFSLYLVTGRSFKLMMLFCIGPDKEIYERKTVIPLMHFTLLTYEKANKQLQ